MKTLNYIRICTYAMALMLIVGKSWALDPLLPVPTTNMDASTDSPAAARADLFELTTRFNRWDQVPVGAYASLTAAVAAIGSSQKTLVVNSATSTTGATVIPATLSVRVESPGVITSNYALTISGSFEAGNYQVFAGSGTVTGLKNPKAVWLGATNGVNSTSALQATFASGTGTFDLGGNNYIATDTLLMPSNSKLINGTITFSPTTEKLTGIGINGKTNVTIEGVTVTCTDHVLRPISIYGNSSQVKVIGSTISNPSTSGAGGNTYAIFASSSGSVEIAGNKISIDVAAPLTTIGYSGIYAGDSSDVFIHHNTITKARGKFGDGIYTFSLLNSTISENNISDVTRIGIVVEGDGVTLASGLNIHHNNIDYAHGSTAPEINTAIWVENGKSDSSVIVSKNICTRSGTRGIQLSNGSTATGNDISGAANYGIVVGTGGGDVRDNRIHGNLIGIEVASLAAGSYVSMTGNDIYANTQGGVQLYQTRGIYVLEGNTIRDNGSAGAAYPNYGYGLAISRYYNNQTVITKNNTFISSANAGATAGQLYAIVGIDGGDFTFTSYGINDNKFLFTGTLAAYPSNLAVAPVSFATDNTSAITARELVDQNENSKVRQQSKWTNFGGANTGFPRLIGYGSAAPASGTYLAGDMVINDNQSSVAAVYAWVCTTGGTPGTWKKIILTP